MRPRLRSRAAPRAVGLLLLAGLAPALAPALEAQEGTLDRTDSLIARGRVAEARQTLQGWWDRERAEASRADRQRGLWLRGKLTVDPAQARRDYQRLVLEHPGGPYTDRALLRLGQAAHAGERLVEAAGHFERLARDYPDSPLRLEARRWLREHGGEVARAGRDAAVSEPPPGREAPADTAAPVPVPEPGREPPSGEAAEETGEPEPPAEEAGPVSVQLGAFSSGERARALARRVRERGVEVRLVRVEGSELIRVRSGRFPSREAARDLRARLRGMNLEAVIVTDASEETPIQ